MFALLFLAAYLIAAEQPRCDLPANLIDAHECQRINEARQWNR